MPQQVWAFLNSSGESWSVRDLEPDPPGEGRGPLLQGRRLQGLPEGLLMSAPELRGEWPGGMRHNERGYAILDREYRPIFDCRLCRGHTLHTEAEHALILKAAGRDRTEAPS
jgi:hypothetical protein